MVAHELGHACNRAAAVTFERHDALVSGGLIWAHDTEERSVEKLVAAWGFDAGARDRWVSERWGKVKSLAPRGEPIFVVKLTASGYEVVPLCPFCGQVLAIPNEGLRDIHISPRMPSIEPQTPSAIMAVPILAKVPPVPWM